MTKTEAREVYQRIQKYSYEARIGKMLGYTDPSDPEPMDEGTLHAWRECIQLNKTNLLTNGKQYVKEFEKEEGPMKGPSKAQIEWMAKANEPAPPPPVKKKRKVKLSKETLEAYAYWDELFEIMKTDDVKKGMARTAKLAQKDLRSKVAPIWKEIGDFDWESAVEQVSKWMTVVLKKLAKAPHVDFLQIQTGESPEIFAVQGFGMKYGRETLGRVIDMVRDRPQDEEYDKMLRRSDFQDFIYKRTAQLPGKIWKVICDGDEDDDPRLNFYAASTIWDAVSRMGVGQALRNKSLDYSKILGERKCIAMIMGYEESQYIGCLTPKGWDAKP